MQSTSRAQYLCTLCEELRGVLGDKPRNDNSAKAQGLSILQQLRTDPYASLHTHERVTRLAVAIERWFSETLVSHREPTVLKESLFLELAHIETEQRLRSWLIDITS